jgi:hypothetical protein
MELRDEARALIDGASFAPETVKAMGQAFDEAWVQIGPVSDVLGR